MKKRTERQTWLDLRESIECVGEQPIREALLCIVDLLDTSQLWPSDRAAVIEKVIVENKEVLGGLAWHEGREVGLDQAIQTIREEMDMYPMNAQAQIYFADAIRLVKELKK